MSIIYALFLFFVFFYAVHKIGYENIPEWLDTVLVIIFVIFVFFALIFIYAMRIYSWIWG